MYICEKYNETLISKVWYNFGLQSNTTQQNYEQNKYKQQNTTIIVNKLPHFMLNHKV